MCVIFIVFFIVLKTVTCKPYEVPDVRIGAYKGPQKKKRVARHPREQETCPNGCANHRSQEISLKKVVLGSAFRATED